MSFADLRRTVLSARKKAILNDQNFVDVLFNEAVTLAEATGKTSTEIRHLRIVQLYKAGHSQRKIAEL